jgi:sigma-E factor negative regulatory protein RseA
MSDRVREAVSVLMDGEADELAVRRLLTQDAADEARESWSSFHRQRRVIQGADLRFEQWDISQSVMAALADEPTYSQMTKRDQSAWLKPLTGFAVAASVAAIVVVSAPSWRQIEPASVNTVASVNQAAAPTLTAELKNPTAVAQAQSININNPRSVYLANGEQAAAPVLQFPQQFNGGIPVSLQTGGVESTHSYMYDNDELPMSIPEGAILYSPTSQYNSGFIVPAQK